MASKKRSPYDDGAGRGTGGFRATQLAGAVAGETSTAPMSAAASPAAAPAVDAYEGMPDPGLLGAVMSLLFFFPLGIFAVSAALQVRGRWKRGDRAGAIAAAERADRLTYAAVGTFIVIALVLAIGYAIYWVSGPRTHH
jgi:hypothetical protein